MNGILLQIYLLHFKRYIYTYFLIYIILMYANLIIYRDFIRCYNKIGTEKPLFLTQVKQTVNKM